MIRASELTSLLSPGATARLLTDSIDWHDEEESTRPGRILGVIERHLPSVGRQTPPMKLLLDAGDRNHVLVAEVRQHGVTVFSALSGAEALRARSRISPMYGEADFDLSTSRIAAREKRHLATIPKDLVVAGVRRPGVAEINLQQPRGTLLGFLGGSPWARWRGPKADDLVSLLYDGYATLAP